MFEELALEGCLSQMESKEEIYPKTKAKMFSGVCKDEVPVMAASAYNDDSGNSNALEETLASFEC